MDDADGDTPTTADGKPPGSLFVELTGRETLTDTQDDEAREPRAVVDADDQAAAVSGYLRAVPDALEDAIDDPEPG